VLGHQRLPVALNLIMNADTLVDRVWHLRRLPLQRLCLSHHSIWRWNYGYLFPQLKAVPRFEEPGRPGPGIIYYFMRGGLSSGSNIDLITAT
jgi:hypothetical protein